MAFIYKITNDINDKVYIGKTLSSVEKRWKEHLKDSKNRRYEKRPLYSAMRKYGSKHFSIEVLEKCFTEEASDREIYWIAYFNSYKHGYNATKGGDGKPFVNYNTIGIFWVFNKSVQEIQQLTGYSNSTIRDVLHRLGIDKSYIVKRGNESSYKAVNMFSKDGDFIRSFSSITEANNYIKSVYNYKISGGGGHIPCACSGKRTTAYGYRWTYK